MSDPTLKGVRPHVVDYLRSVAPATWDVKPGIVTPGALAKTTIFVEYARLTPLPAAPLGRVRAEFTVAIVDHRTDLSKAEDSIDEDVVDLITVLDKHPTILWTLAEKANVNDYLGWKIDLSIPADPSPEPDPEPEPEPDELEPDEFVIDPETALAP